MITLCYHSNRLNRCCFIYGNVLSYNMCGSLPVRCNFLISSWKDEEMIKMNWTQKMLTTTYKMMFTWCSMTSSQRIRAETRNNGSHFYMNAMMMIFRRGWHEIIFKINDPDSQTLSLLQLEKTLEETAIPRNMETLKSNVIKNEEHANMNVICLNSGYIKSRMQFHILFGGNDCKQREMSLQWNFVHCHVLNLENSLCSITWFRVIIIGYISWNSYICYRGVACFSRQKTDVFTSPFDASSLTRLDRPTNILSQVLTLVWKWISWYSSLR
jgi:hypothetical protein